MEALQRALEAHDAEAVEALLAESCVFRSPALFEPYAGRAATMVFLRAVMEVFENFRYTRTFSDDAGGGSVTARGARRRLSLSPGPHPRR